VAFLVSRLSVNVPTGKFSQEVISLFQPCFGSLGVPVTCLLNLQLHLDTVSLSNNVIASCPALGSILPTVTIIMLQL